ncbi:hypothetical protein WOLCODRAFT_90853 [Wolfiporia cocos MD-104 SS10]|uniref:RING-type E3 ubiquitin transferase n=1 Tax=Wolfiporia cocos (strain MD-104) TaxID=742152 RepID=A0A2H3JQP1_WOLCO|nr:hypothetical protein WOLCODRAFT_90853 [Wolfiporia cocos MD-104 SS10]
MQDEPVTCRICSTPAEPGQPLFHPCKCSGTIRYIHQDCLTEWLAHSKKKTCDICKHPYSFTKVYSPDMPERLPLLLLIRQLSRQAVSAVLFLLRATMVGMVWLALLPLATIWTWRMYFALGDSTAWYISNRPRPPVVPEPANVLPPSNASAPSTAMDNSTSTTPVLLLAHPLVRATSADIVSGQIIASLIVLAFVAIFLLREWISQNARPGVFDDIEVDVPVAEAEAEAEAQPQPDNQDAQALLDHEPAPQPELWQRVQELPDQLSIPQLPAPEPIPGVDDEVQERRLRTRSLDRQGARDFRDEPSRDGPNKRPRYAPSDDEDAVHELRERRLTREAKGKRVVRREPHLGWATSSAVSSKDFNGAATQDKPEPLQEWQEALLRRRRMQMTPEVIHRPSRPLNLPLDQTQFTFTASSSSEWTDITEETDAVANTEVEGDRPLTTRLFGAPDVPEDIPLTASPTVEASANLYERFIEPRSLPPPHSAESRRAGSPSSAIPASPTLVPSLPLSDHEEDTKVFDIFEPRAPTPSSELRRPTLPSATLPPSSGASPAASVYRSRGPTPLGSPNLATYRPPEELEAGPSTLTSYFDEEAHMQEEGEEEEMAADYNAYFRDIQPAPGASEPTGFNTIAPMENDIEPADLWSEENNHSEDGVDNVAAEERMQPREFVPANVAEDVPRQDMRVDFVRPRDPEEVPEQIEDFDGIVEDDMDGALEAIGLRGPLHGLLQNAALMIFILDATIGTGVWIPFTIGKSAALLVLDPPRLLQILHLPLRIIRLVTDPVVDGVAWLVTRLLLPTVLQIANVVLNAMLKASTIVVGTANAAKAAAIGQWINKETPRILMFMSDCSAQWLSKSDVTSTSSSPTLLDRLVESDSPVLRAVEPYFAPLGQRVRLDIENVKVEWLRLATGDGPNEKVFAVALGYAVIGLMIALYLNVLTLGNVKNAGRAVRNAVRQQLLVVKVAVFIVVELVVFPLGCGIMLDACTVWLLPQGDLNSRLTFFKYAPITSIFYHWVVGTMFMYQFAVLLAGCRGIMRPGAMWFIKDPQDQNFHPIRDILERSTLVQVRKLLLSAVMYGIVVAAGVGTVSGVLQIFSRTILPFRWKVREPLSAVPVDLLFLHLVMPYTMHYFRPKKLLRRFGIQLWRYLAHQLRLTSYMFGGRHFSEEFTPVRWTWRSLFIPKGDIEMDDAEATHDGSFRRVPNSDNVVVLKDAPATAEVDETGRPVNDEQRKLIDAQDAEAQKAKRNIKEDYAIVYVPPNLRCRVITFIFCIWIVGSVLLGLALGAPIVLGRQVLGLFIPHVVHDGYAFITGFYLLWACLLIPRSFDRLDKRRQRRLGKSGAQWPLYAAKRSLLWIAKMSYMVFFLGFVIPTLIAVVLELYIVQPIRHIADPPSEPPRIRVVDMWGLGLLYTEIIIRCLRLQPRNDFIQGIDQIKRLGWTSPDPIKATKEVIAPVMTGLLGMIFLPAGLLWGVHRALSLPLPDDFLFAHVYPSLFTVAGFTHAVVALSKVFGSWSQTIRDKEFLLEMRLQNHEPRSEQDRESNEVDLEIKEEEEEEAE